MAALFEELDWAETPWGEISLRRRRDRITRRTVYEVKLDDDYLMSSQFTATEQALASLGLAALEGERLEVMVGGLGLGYTAAEALLDPRVARVSVIEALAPVIDWHQRDLLPATAGLAADPRLDLHQHDFFALVRDGAWSTPLDALLVDIDHSPAHLLREDHGDFYTEDGLRAAARMLRPHGVLGLWSDDPPDHAFTAHLGAVFETVEAHTVAFANPITDGTSACSVYVAARPAAASS